MQAKLLYAAVATIALSGCSMMHGGNREGWTTLFDGKSLDAFNRAGDANWRIEDGAAVADRGRGFLVTKGQYKDFEIHVEFWADEEANSGIYYRCTSATELTNDTCYEANIFDKRPDQSGRTGAIVHIAKPLAIVDAGGKWNTYDLTVRGDHMVLVMNGMTTADGHDTKRMGAGYVGLQRFDGVVKDKGTIKFRKAEIRPLP